VIFGVPACAGTQAGWGFGSGCFPATNLPAALLWQAGTRNHQIYFQ